MIPNIDYEAAVFFRSLGNEELQAVTDALTYEMADVAGLYADDSAPVAALLTEPRLRAAETELARRTRLHASSAGVPDPHDARYEAWRVLACQVRERTDIVAVFQSGGYHLDRVGRGEWAGACLLCAGRDRFRVFTGPPGRYWCRRCGIAGDAITAARTLNQLGFFGAVRQLAAELGLATPAASGAASSPDTVRSMASGAVLMPIRGTGRRRGR